MAARLTLFLSLISVSAFAQFASPITWTFSQRHLEGDEFELVATATAEENWSIYSQFTDEGGPVPTTFYWEEGDHYERIGETRETGHRKEGVDELFGVNVIKFLSDQPTVFTQRIRVLQYGTPVIGEVEFMCCDDTQCLPPTTEPYSFTLAAQAPAVEEEKPEPEAAKPAAAKVPEEADPLPAAEAPAAEQAPSDPEEATVLATHRVSLPPPTEEDPVSWSFRVDELGGGRYRLALTGTMLESWTVYSKDVDPDIGPIPTEWVLEESDGLEVLGEVSETADHRAL